jgi:hypothetical protein
MAKRRLTPPLTPEERAHIDRVLAESAAVRRDFEAMYERFLARWQAERERQERRRALTRRLFPPLRLLDR